MTTATVLILQAVTVTVLALLLVLMPVFVPATVPLGVSVPTAQAHHPVIAAATRRFRLYIAVSWVLTLGIALLLAQPAPELAATIPTLVFIAFGAISYVSARRPIQQTKHAEQWYADVPVRIQGEVTPAAPSRPPLGWLAASIAVVVITVIWGAALYSGMPQSVPVHWNAEWVVDRTAPKSVWAVFSVPITAAALAVALFILSLVLQRAPRRAGSAARDGILRERIAGRLLGQVSLVVALMLCISSVLGWVEASGTWHLVTTVGGLLLMLVLVVVAIVPFAHIRGPQRATSNSEAPDTDKYWRGGLLYINRNDPAILVQKRFGVGWSINFGSPVGIVIGVLLALVIIGGVVTAVLSSS